MLIFSLILVATLTAAIFYIVRLRGMLARDSDERARWARGEDVRNHVLELLAQGAPLKRVLNAIVGKVEQERLDLLCSILLVDSEGKYLYTGAAPSLPDVYNDAVTGSEVAMGVAAFGTAAFTGQRAITENIATHPYWADYREAAERAGLASCWAEAIRYADGRVLGVIAVYRREPHQPDAAEIRIVEQAANLAEIALGRSHADTALREHEQMLSNILENVSAHIYMKDREGRYLFANRPLRERLAAPMEEIVGYDDSKFFTADDAATMREHEMQVLREGEPLEVDEELWNIVENEPQVFLTVRIPLLREDGSIHALCGISTDISTRKDAEKDLQRMAQYDKLTGLPNRALFDDRLKQALAAAQRNSTRLALMFIDLDRFKPVNDTYGHAVGDLLLQEVAQRLVDCLRESDTAARVGGDEFVVLLPLVETEADAETVAGKILAALNRPFRLAGQRLGIGGSIGVAVFPDHGEEEHVLVKSADIAMYHAKKSGRNNIKLYHVGLQAEVKQAG